MARIWTIVALTVLIVAGSIAAGRWPSVLWPVTFGNGLLGVVIGHLIFRMVTDRKEA